jgi:hypothetical protein
VSRRPALSLLITLEHDILFIRPLRRCLLSPGMFVLTEELYAWSQVSPSPFPHSSRKQEKVKGQHHVVMHLRFTDQYSRWISLRNGADLLWFQTPPSSSYTCPFTLLSSETGAQNSDGTAGWLSGQDCLPFSSNLAHLTGWCRRKERLVTWRSV